ncbi:MAG: formylglycine-generating enzyme family protein [Terracidiphilus sp.]
MKFVWTSLAIFVLLAPSAMAKKSNGKKRVNHEDGLTYIWIPAGSYQAGCLDGDTHCIGNERTKENISIADGFWISETEVTQAAYKKVMNAEPSYYQGSRLPVERDSWTDADAYCRRAGMRLPTEAEWEYAAYGGAERLPASLDAVAWYNPNSSDQTHPVREKQPNGFGLYDMLGNVWEWVSDAGATADDHLVKGGSLYSGEADLRVAGRQAAPADLKHRDIGFRCASNTW